MRNSTNQLLLRGMTLLAVLGGCSTNDKPTATDKPAATNELLEAAKQAAATEPTAPREYEVEYRFSSTTASQAENVGFMNETGGGTEFNDVKLPATYKFKRTMKQYEGLAASAYLDQEKKDSDLTIEILLDGKEVQKQTARGDRPQLSVTYMIGQP